MGHGALQIDEWLRTPLGVALLTDEAETLRGVLGEVFGDQLLQIGRWGDEGQLLEHARTLRSNLIAADPGPGVEMCTNPCQLALASASIDAVILPHTLELHDAPHDVLRESARVLRGEGHLITLGFNPWGLWGARRLLSRNAFPPASRRFIPEGRMRDWMAILGFNVRKVVRYGYGLPSNRLVGSGRQLRFERTAQRLWPALSGGYLLVARKRVYTMTPARPVKFKKRVVAGLVEPSTRNSAARIKHRAR